MPHDVVVVGSGINAMVAAATLARAGRSVAVLEREDRLGGAVHTLEDHPAPGWTTDAFSCWWPLFVGGPAYPELSGDLEARGVVFRNTDRPAGVALADGGTGVLSTDLDTTAAAFDALHPGDGQAWRDVVEDFGSRADLAFGALGKELWSGQGVRLATTAARQLGVTGLLQLGSEALEPARPWLRRTFGSEVVRALLSPWTGHNGLGPDDAASAFINKTIALALAQGGCPVVQGGGIQVVEALAGVVRDAGGTVRTDADVVHVSVRDGRARGVVLADGEPVDAADGVLASVTPQALYSGLLADEPAVPDRVRRAADRYRFGRGDMQIHLALSEPLRWVGSSELDSTAVVHVTPGLDGISAACNAATRDVLPARPTIVAGQPAVLDPTRVPQGAGSLWIQLQETPYRPVADEADAIDVGDGTWTHDLKERYADRVLDHLRPHVRDLDSVVVARAVHSPADLERTNVNLVQGDPYSGACTLDQFLLWRPVPSLPSHRTPVEALWHIGASTHPGPGLSGASGLLAAQELLAGPGLVGRARALAGSVGEVLERVRS